MISLNELLNSISTIERSNTTYYRLNELHNVLNEMHGKQIEVDDMILTPFYICDLGILEIYDYELNIRIVDRPSEENFILTKTGKKSIDEVGIEIKQKIRNCYLELVKPQRFLEVNMIGKYIEFVKVSSEIKKRISEYLHEFDNDKLYFEIY